MKGQEEGGPHWAPVCCCCCCRLGDSRVSRKVSSGTWTRDSPRPPRRGCRGLSPRPLSLGGRGRSTAGEAAGGKHACLSGHPGETSVSSPCPPLLQPALCPPTSVRSHSAVGGHAGWPEQPLPGTGRPGLSAVPMAGKKAQPCPAVGPPDPTAVRPHRARQRLTVPRPASAARLGLGPSACLRVP